MKVVKHWGKKSSKPTDQQISNCTVDIWALRHAAGETVTETRGDFKDYRPGDIWRMLQGAVFQR